MTSRLLPWRGVQSLPREVALRQTPDGIRLVQAPIRELATLRARREPAPVTTGAALPGGAEIELEVQAGDWSEAGFRLSNSAGEEVIVGVRAQPLEVFVDRQRSRATPFHDEYPGRHAAPARWSNGRIALRAIFDRTTLEVFANGGEIVLSERVYPTRPFDRIEPLGGRLGEVVGASVKACFSVSFLAVGLVGSGSPGRRPHLPSAVAPARAESTLAPRWWESAPRSPAWAAREGKAQLPARRRVADARARRSPEGRHHRESRCLPPPTGGRASAASTPSIATGSIPTLGTMEDFTRPDRAGTHARHGGGRLRQPRLLQRRGDRLPEGVRRHARRAARRRKRRSYLWSDRADAPPPGHQAGNTFFFVRPTHLPGGKPGTFYESTKHEFWAWSERAGKYYWSKWAGVDLAGKDVRLPAVRLGQPGFPGGSREDRALLDGHRHRRHGHRRRQLVRRPHLGACTASHDGRHRRYDNSYSQPEGAGGFREDPVAWITEGGWNSVQDYGLGIWWEDGIGRDRQRHRQRRSAADRARARATITIGSWPPAGRYISHAPKFDAPRQARLAIAIVAARRRPRRDELPRRVSARPAHAAARPEATAPGPAAAEHAPPAADAAPDRHYAFLRTAADRSERILVVMNFRPTAESVRVDASGLSCTDFLDLRTAASRACGRSIELTVGARLRPVDLSR